MKKEKTAKQEHATTKKNNITSYTKIILYAILFAFTIEYFGAKGAIGIITIIILIALYKLWTFKEQFMTSLRYIETMIYKKPLDKEHWKKNELKKTKIRIKRRKKIT